MVESWKLRSLTVYKTLKWHSRICAFHESRMLHSAHILPTLINAQRSVTLSCHKTSFLHVRAWPLSGPSDKIEVKSKTWFFLISKKQFHQNVNVDRFSFGHKQFAHNSNLAHILIIYSTSVTRWSDYFKYLSICYNAN